MSEQIYDVVYAGAIKEGFSQEDVKATFVQKFKLSTDKVDRYFSGNRMILKKSLSKIKAENLKEKLMGIGAETLIVPCIGIADTNNAKAKNKQHEQMSKIASSLNGGQKRKYSSATSNLKQSELDSEIERAGFESSSVADKALNQKIKLAQSMMMEQQLKSQITDSKSPPKYTKLVLFLIVLAGAVWFLLDLGKNSL